MIPIEGITKTQFQRQLTVPLHKQTLLRSKDMKDNISRSF